MTKGTPSVYELRSQGSGKLVRVNFCATCGTKLYLAFERFTDCYGIYAGTFDDPNWFVMSSDNTKQIFVSVARPETILQAGIPTFRQHARLNDGTTVESFTLDHPPLVSQLSV